MAKCFDVTGYIEPCNVVRQKYTGRALLITGNLVEDNDVSLSDNGLKVTQIAGGTSFDQLRSEAASKNIKLLPIIIDAQNPFGVTIQGNTDSGRVSYTKTILVTIPATRDGKAEEFIMGLQKGLYSLAVMALETVGDTRENDFFGAHSPLRLDPTSVTRNEYENGGAWSLNLVCEEPVPNVICTMMELGVAIDALNV